MAVTDYDYINYRYIGKVTRRFRVSLWAHPSEGRAALFEDRIEEYTETTREFDVVAGMA